MAWLERHPARELVITGHSLGGAMAQFAAFELAGRYAIAAVVCFGAPLIGWRAFASAYESTTVSGRPGVTLGEVTTTFVFKSDLVRTLLLPRLGCQRVGQEIVIDETGRPNDDFAPWYVDAFATTYTAIAGDDAPQYVSHGPPLPAPPLTLRMVVDKIRPMGAVVVKGVSALQAIVLAFGAADGRVPVGTFLRARCRLPQCRRTLCDRAEGARQVLGAPGVPGAWRGTPGR